MPRYDINGELSFRHPAGCTVQPRFNGRGFRLDFADADADLEVYYVKWIQSKSPKLVWEWLASSPFDKKKDLAPVERAVKVSGFTLRPLPNIRALKLGHGQYASFRGSEYEKDYDGTEWVELTWARMYGRTVDEKFKVLGMGFTASGEAGAVTGRLREHLLNLHGGFLFRPPDVAEWRRIEFPARTRPKEPAAPPPPNEQTPWVVAAAEMLLRQRAQGLQNRTNYSAGPVVLPTRQCGACSGSGNQVCGSCHGSGGRYDSYTSYDYDGNLQYEQQWITCPCSGGYTSCGACAGRGRVYS